METFDKLNASFSNREAAEDFIHRWDSIFEEEFYFEYVKKKGRFIISEDRYCLFRFFEDGSRIDLVVLGCLKNNPSTSFEMEYTNGDGIALKYDFKDGVLIRKFICDNEGCERDSLDYCEECDKYFDPPMFTLLTFDPSRKYVCPRCGTDLLKQFKPTVKSFELKLINNEWNFPNGFAP